MSLPSQITTARPKKLWLSVTCLLGAKIPLITKAHAFFATYSAVRLSSLKITYISSGETSVYRYLKPWGYDHSSSGTQLSRDDGALRWRNISGIKLSWITLGQQHNSITFWQTSEWTFKAQALLIFKRRHLLACQSYTGIYLALSFALSFARGNYCHMSSQHTTNLSAKPAFPLIAMNRA